MKQSEVGHKELEKLWRRWGVQQLGHLVVGTQTTAEIKGTENFRAQDSFRVV